MTSTLASSTTSSSASSSSSQNSMPSPSSVEKTGARLTFGYLDAELQPASSIPPSPTRLLTPPLSPVVAESSESESGPIFVSTSLPVMHYQLSDRTVGDDSTAPLTPVSQTQPPSTAAPEEDSTMFFFSPTSASIKRSATTKSLSRPNSPHPLLIPAHPLRGRSSSLNSAISFTGSLDHRSMTRVRSTSSKTSTFRSRRIGAPQAITPSCSMETLHVNTNAKAHSSSGVSSSSSSSSSPMVSSPQELIVTAPLPQPKSRRASVVAFLSSAPVRSRIAHSPRGENESGDMLAAGTLRPSPSSSSLSLQASPGYTGFSRSNSVRIGAGARHVKQRSASFLADFDSTRPQFQYGIRRDDKDENDVDTLCNTTLDDNDSHDHLNDSYAYDKTLPATTATTDTTDTTSKKTKKMKMWYPSLSMFNFMLKSKKKL